ncbi:hypothetical protein MAR_008786 [Mya arenaria]|uniref:Reelin domain-containing protein n=1 Tax=Mya arenaria TaxID=6604 RepID=A0ABY7E050_MYAAR|nr:hypothetical protein MAR_008786 [Mya arenaria]
MHTAAALAASMLILSCLNMGFSYPNGAPPSSCSSMKPGHVTLAALKGFNFTGFLCQARPDQADNATTGTLYGEYSKTTNNCDGKGSVTHSTRDLKESMVLKWKANSNYTSVTFVV